MEIQVNIVKGIPKENIRKFEDRVVYYTAVATREYTKSHNAFPYLSGELARQEVASPITGNNAEYNLLTGTDYAKYVWKMKNVNWTNKQTTPSWYYNIYRQKGAVLTLNATMKALKEIK